MSPSNSKGPPANDQRWTAAARGGKDARDPYQATSPPLYQTATFAQESACAFGEFDYTRTDNPTRRSAEELLRELEGAEHALLFASGMAAIAATLRLARPGAHILLGRDLYGGTQRFAHGFLEGVSASHVSFEPDASGDLTELRRALEANDVALVVFETPSNPSLTVTDISSVCRLAHQHGALVAVDGTAMTPWLQRPLHLGADLVIHSATKGLGGHGDVTAGLVATNSAALHGALMKRRNAEGSALAPFEAWLLARGVRTLGVRIERAQESAGELAIALDSAEGLGIRSVLYPGLAHHPGSALHARQSDGGGVLISMEMESQAAAQRIVERTRLFSTAVSFGGVASSISLPHHMSHASVPEGAAPRPSPALVRLSVGLESPADLLADIRQAAGEIPDDIPMKTLALTQPARV